LKSISADVLSQVFCDNSFVVIDVRSPKEFAHNHFPAAINLPVLDDHEHARVGEEYVQKDKKQAKRQGAALISKNIARHLEDNEQFKNFENNFLLICARGGQRSSSFAHVLDEIGFKVSVLDGGHKAYRKELLKLVETAPVFPGIAVHGPSGSGKTQLLQNISKKIDMPFLDLETYAGHRGSRYGGLGREPRNQKTFEIELWKFLLSNTKTQQPVLVEGESRRVGKALIPKSLFDWMGHCQKIWVELPLELRAQNLVDDYFGDTPDETITEGFIQISESLIKDKGQSYFDDVKNKIRSGRYLDAAILLLTDFFDPLYDNCKTNDKREIISLSAETNSALEEKLQEKITEIGYCSP
jgi:tRNA 2-selenouridine synthase